MAQPACVTIAEADAVEDLLSMAAAH